MLRDPAILCACLSEAERVELMQAVAQRCVAIVQYYGPYDSDTAAQRKCIEAIAKEFGLEK